MQRQEPTNQQRNNGGDMSDLHPGLKHEQPEYAAGYEQGRADERERCMDAIYKCENLTPAQQYFAIEAIKAE